MNTASKTFPKGLLAFELSVLRRQKFSSVSIPLSPDTALPAYLKRCGVKVAANDRLRSSAAAGYARIVNNSHLLSDDEVGVVLDDAYVPGYKLENPSLLNWFREPDAWWFDNVRRNIDNLASPVSRAIAANLAIGAGRYALSFSEETRQFRRPLSVAFRRLWSIEPEPFDNGSTNIFRSDTAEDFLADTAVIENFNELLFLRLPEPHTHSIRESLAASAWEEEWMQGRDDLWNDLELRYQGTFGGATATKSHYLSMLGRLLEVASNIRTWAIAHMETGFISADDIVEAVGKHRRVDTLYTKDLTELTGTKAVIVTA